MSAKNKASDKSSDNKTTAGSIPESKTADAKAEDTRDSGDGAKPNANAPKPKPIAGKRPFTCLRCLSEAGNTYREGQTVHLTPDRAAAIGRRFLAPAKKG